MRERRDDDEREEKRGRVSDGPTKRRARESVGGMVIYMFSSAVVVSVTRGSGRSVLSPTTCILQSAYVGGAGPAESQSKNATTPLALCIQAWEGGSWGADADEQRGRHEWLGGGRGRGDPTAEKGSCALSAGAGRSPVRWGSCLAWPAGSPCNHARHSPLARSPRFARAIGH